MFCEPAEKGLATRHHLVLDNFNLKEKPMDSSDSKINRREFLQRSAVVAAGRAALSSTALSYARIAGANERISLGHIGVGSRGSEIGGIVAVFKDPKKVEVTAGCDLWRHKLEQIRRAAGWGRGE